MNTLRSLQLYVFSFSVFSISLSLDIELCFLFCRFFFLSLFLNNLFRIPAWHSSNFFFHLNYENQKMKWQFRHLPVVSSCGTTVGTEPFAEREHTFVVHRLFNLTLYLDIQFIYIKLLMVWVIKIQRQSIKGWSLLLQGPLKGQWGWLSQGSWSISAQPINFEEVIIRVWKGKTNFKDLH